MRALRFAKHLRCLAEDATDADLSLVQPLAVVRDRVRKQGRLGTVIEVIGA